MDFSGISSLINAFTVNVVRSLGYLFMTMAVVAFFWGIVEFIWASRSGETKGVDNGKKLMLWGLIALFVMFSVWGIIKFAQKTLGPDFQETTIKIPSIEFGKSGNQGGSPLDTGDTNVDLGGGAPTDTGDTNVDWDTPVNTEKIGNYDTNTPQGCANAGGSWNLVAGTCSGLSSSSDSSSSGDSGGSPTNAGSVDTTKIGNYDTNTPQGCANSGGSWNSVTGSCSGI